MGSVIYDFCGESDLLWNSIKPKPKLTSKLNVLNFVVAL
jgi:hypothetical protein